MSCCKSVKKDYQLSKQPCPLCNMVGNHIHYLAVERVVKEDVVSQVKRETYFTCVNDNCDVVFYNEYNDGIFLAQDINMGADFDEITKTNKNKCNSNSKCGGCKKY